MLTNCGAFATCKKNKRAERASAKATTQNNAMKTNENNEQITKKQETIDVTHQTTTAFFASTHLLPLHE